MDRAGTLPPAEEPGIPREAAVDGRGHGQPGQDRQRGQEEHHGEVSQMLERIVPVEAVRLGGHVERRVVDQHGPGLRDDLPGVGHDPTPFARGAEQDHEDDPVGDPEQGRPGSASAGRSRRCAGPRAGRARARHTGQSSLAVQTRSVGTVTGVRRSHSEPGVQWTFQ